MQEGGCLIVGYPGVAVAVVFNPFPIFLCSTHTECVTNRPRRHTHTNTQRYTNTHTHTHIEAHTHTQSHQKNSLLLTSRLAQTRFQFFLFYRDIRYTIYSIYDIILRGKGGTVVPPSLAYLCPSPYFCGGSTNAHNNLRRLNRRLRRFLAIQAGRREGRRGRRVERLRVACSASNCNLV